MGLASFPFSKLSCKMFSNSLPLICKPTTSHPSCIHLKTNHKNLIQRPFPIRYKCLSIMAFGSKKSASGEEDKRALETVLKLYTALRNRNITELSEVIGEECRCVCNFISIFQPFQGKKQVLDFFSSLMKYLGNNIEFVVQPTLHDGMNVGVSWRLEWKETHVPLGKGFSFYMCHIYQGKMAIRNVEMFMEPLLHIEPFRLKLIGFVTTVMDKIGLFNGKGKKAIPYFLLALSIMIALLFFM